MCCRFQISTKSSFDVPVSMPEGLEGWGFFGISGFSSLKVSEKVDADPLVSN